ncbi:hypothetical protein [Actinacidiphila oryziradicis]|uniref:Uncharacterized protein n=1 Tax=Actinacidiphila oryziradicis TaxID=2571141 RepID=A0A4U0RYE2_9ACTN|nr:hypothetical protein [Actinacidiphila oryziradicis]TKA01390.1 hypothetical protein FCI23_40660 [Actinacidiphila oryziradicis]
MGPAMHDDLLHSAALATVTAAVAVVALAGKPPTGRRRRWRYPLAILLIAAADIGLTVVVASRPDRRIGLVLLVAAVLLGYGMHRRIRVLVGPRPPRR